MSMCISTAQARRLAGSHKVCVPILDHLLVTKDFGLLISHAVAGQTFNVHLIPLDSLHS